MNHFPIVILEKGQAVPDGTCYILARDGVYLKKDTGLIAATVKVGRISALAEVSPQAIIRIPKIPQAVFAQAYLFFRRVYQRFRSEAVVVMYYCEETGTYKLHCPSQEVSGASVRYVRDCQLSGYKAVGSIHSHAAMSAFHSWTDEKDEEDFDGIHITIGDLDCDYFTLATTLVVNDNRFRRAPEEVIEGLRQIEVEMPRVRRRRRPRVSEPQPHRPILETIIDPLGLGAVIEGAVSALNGDWFAFGDEQTFQDEPQKRMAYMLDLPEGQDLRSFGFPTSWLSLVSREDRARGVKRPRSQRLVYLPVKASGGKS